MSGDFNRAWNFLIVQTSLRFFFRCWVDNCSFVFRGHIDQFYNYFCSARIAVVSSAVLVATRCEFFFLTFRQKRWTMSLLFFFFILLRLRRTILQRGKWNMLSPISLLNDFSGIVLSRLNEASSSLCCNFIVIILVWSSYECQIGFNKTFLYKESFADSEIETFCKARDPTNEKKSIFVSEILKSRLQLVLPTVFKEMLTTPHGKDNLKLTQTKVRMLLFFASVCLAWRV